MRMRVLNRNPCRCNYGLKRAAAREQGIHDFLLLLNGHFSFCFSFSWNGTGHCDCGAATNGRWAPFTCQGKVKPSARRSLNPRLIKWSAGGFVKKQQMEWTLRGACTSSATDPNQSPQQRLDNVFRHWYPQFRAATCPRLFAGLVAFDSLQL